MNESTLKDQLDELAALKQSAMDAAETYKEGELKNIGSAKRIRLQSGDWVNRDEVGARNILLRALVDSPDCFTVAVIGAC